MAFSLNIYIGIYLCFSQKKVKDVSTFQNENVKSLKKTRANEEITYFCKFQAESERFRDIHRSKELFEDYGYPSP